MPQLKTFTSASNVDDVARLERAVNEWLEREQPHIVFMSQSPFGDNLVLSFLYEAYNADYAIAVAEVEHAVEVPEVFERNMTEAELDPTEEADTLLPEAELPY